MQNVSQQETILEKIISHKDQLPKKQRLLCNYLLENHEHVGLYTVKELADKAGVGTTTVLRLVKNLGYDSFFELKKEFHKVQLDFSDKWENVQKSYLGKNESPEYKVISQVWEEGINALNKSLHPQLVENFQQAMDLMEHAERINILGTRPYKATALYLELMIEEFYSNTRQLSFDGESIFDRIIQFKENEVFLIFSFEPNTKRALDAAAVAHAQGVSIILITDQLSSPLAAYAEVILKLESSDQYYTILPIIALIEAIAIELGKRKSDTSVDNIKKLVKTLKEQNITL